jgi:hypothetical protein
MNTYVFSALALLMFTTAAVMLALPVIVASTRDVEGKRDVILLSLLLGWTGVGWVCALALAFALPRRAQSVPRHDGGLSEPYRDGAYLVSAGTESNTWAVHRRGEWQIVYELAGTERIVGTVAENDVPLSVLATALRGSES